MNIIILILQWYLQCNHHMGDNCCWQAEAYFGSAVYCSATLAPCEAIAICLACLCELRAADSKTLDSPRQRANNHSEVK